ncbi:MAG: hypothetical protein JO356_03760 [Acidobacteria bacterium]|nr:hypothetical protein [Acidobacteriota bacterium]
MRNSSVLTALFPQVRQGVLAATLTQPEKWWYLSELAEEYWRTAVREPEPTSKPN